MSRATGPPDAAGPGHDTRAPTATTTNHPQQVAGPCHVTSHGAAQQLRARRVAVEAVRPLACGCREVWPHRVGCPHRDDPALSERLLDGAHTAAVHLLELGYTPIFSVDTLRALWQRDPNLVQKLYDLAGGD